ncbi:hypothetical protein TRIP_D440026 [uncultured Paludibacter sp.]|nr:hypothetical protein TRIP_D440026 [uncultured Paludibacter sp.]
MSKNYFLCDMINYQIINSQSDIYFKNQLIKVKFFTQK